MLRTYFLEQGYPVDIIKKIIYNSKWLTRDKLKRDYVKEILDDDDIDIIVVNYDSNGAIRGYAIISEYTTADEKQNFYDIKILCCAQKPMLKTRFGPTRHSGKEMMEYIEDMANLDRISWIQLNSIICAIPFYYHIGYRFKQSLYFRERDKKMIKTLRKELKYYNNDDEELDEKIIAYFDRYCDNYYNLTYMASKDNWKIDDDEDYTDTISVHRETSRDNGCLMIKYKKCYQNI